MFSFECHHISETFGSNHCQIFIRPQGLKGQILKSRNGHIILAANGTKHIQELQL